MKLAIDKNGNQVLKITSNDTRNRQRGFSIQVNGNLPLTKEKGVHRATRAEVKIYLAKHGTEYQKEAFGTLLARGEYMSNGSAFHQEYYLQFVTEATKAFVLDRIGLDKLLKSNCPHLNDLNIRFSKNGSYWLWDDSPANITLARVANECGERSFPSPSFFTCVGKAAARMLVEEYKNANN